MLVLDRHFKGSLSRNIDDYPDGIVVVVDKPYRWTSADVIRKVKFSAIRHFGKKNLKVGHSGTLDPLASGVLVVCIGNACKQAQAIQATDKQYLAGICFGATTPSYDREKDIDRFYPHDMINAESVAAALPGFLGSQRQLAPLFSAKQVDGVRAYELARKLYADGKALDEAASELLHFSDIVISNLTLEDMRVRGKEADSVPADGASSRINVAPVPEGLPEALIRIDCSKGTYIRSFARDLGERLGTGAFLSSLVRSRCGAYNVNDALGIGDVVRILSE